jgi:hypothetical protein
MTLMTAGTLITDENRTALALFWAASFSRQDRGCGRAGLHRRALLRQPRVRGWRGGASRRLGDLDGDGDLDAVVANSLDDTISVLLNNGDRTFADQVTYPVVENPWSVVLVDLDEDGDLDKPSRRAPSTRL